MPIASGMSRNAKVRLVVLVRSYGVDWSSGGANEGRMYLLNNWGHLGGYHHRL